MNKQIFAPLFGVILLCAVGCGNARHYTYVEAGEDVADSTITPGEAWALVGPNRQEDKTWGILETRQGVQLAKGEVRQVKYGKKNSTYQIEGHDSTFTLPNRDFKILQVDSILRTTDKLQKIECIVVTPEPIECEVRTGLRFTSDSITVNAEPPKRLVTSVGLSEVDWAYIGGASRQIPQIPAVLAYSKDSVPEAAYMLAIEIDGKAVCELLPLDPEDKEGLNKTQVLQPSMRVFGKHFENRKDGPTYKGKRITGFKVLTDYKVPGKAKRRKHDSRDRYDREKKRKEHQF